MYAYSESLPTNSLSVSDSSPWNVHQSTSSVTIEGLLASGADLLNAYH